MYKWCGAIRGTEGGGVVEGFLQSRSLTETLAPDGAMAADTDELGREQAHAGIQPRPSTICSSFRI